MCIRDSNKTTVTIGSNFLLYPVICLLLIFSLIMVGCRDDENEEEPSVPEVPDVPDYSTIIVKDIQNIPDNFTFDRVEVEAVSYTHLMERTTRIMKNHGAWEHNIGRVTLMCRDIMPVSAYCLI